MSSMPSAEEKGCTCHHRQLCRSQAPQRPGMGRQTSAFRLPLHPDLRLMAQCRRGLLRQPRKETAQARRVPIPARTQGCHPSLPRRNQRKPKTLYLDQGPEQNHRRRQTRAPSVRFAPLASLNEAARKAGGTDDIGRQRDAIRLAKAAADYFGAAKVVEDDNIKGLARLDGGNDAGFAEALANDLGRLPTTQSYGGGIGQSVKDALSSLGGWIGNGLSDAVLKAKRADLSRGVAFFLGTFCVLASPR
jgi:hypothetical protein